MVQSVAFRVGRPGLTEGMGPWHHNMVETHVGHGHIGSVRETGLTWIEGTSAKIAKRCVNGQGVIGSQSDGPQAGPRRLKDASATCKLTCV